MLVLLAFITLFLGARGASDVDNITAAGYIAEEHHVTTSDGYILSLQRIPYGKNSRNNTSIGKVVFLMHGLLAGSNSFTYLGSDYGMGYNLADAGYDVWMGNNRGNKYSRRHVSLDPDNDELKFFNYTYEEIALYDLPAMIDYILAITKQDKLYYIGHSQGGTDFLVLNSMTSTYQSKFISAHLLAGIGYQQEFPNKKMEVICNTISPIYPITSSTGYVEMKPSSLFTKILINTLVNSTVPDPLINGAAFKQGVHFCQNILDKTFARFDDGARVIKDLLKLGKQSSSLYDLSRINVDVTFHYGLNDLTQSETDVLAMVKAMPNAKARKVNKSDFDHMDYLVRPNVKELVTDYIIKCLQ